MKNRSGMIASIHSTATQWKHKFNIEITLEKASISKIKARLLNYVS